MALLYRSEVEIAHSSSLIMALLRHALLILLKPKLEWPVIAAETITPRQLFIGYIIPLSAIGPLATKVRLIEFISSNPGSEIFVDVFGEFTLTGLATSYVWQLVEIYVLAIFVNWVAPLFSGERNLVQALKVLAFSLTSMWIGKIFFVIPVFSLDKSMIILSILYTAYLLYLGLSVLMKVSRTRALLYTGIVIAALWGASRSRRAAIPVILDFPKQWPVLDQGTKTLLAVLLILTVVGVVLFSIYGKFRKMS